MRVAFLGLGRMGRPMASNVAGAGHDVVLFNRTGWPTTYVVWQALDAIRQLEFARQECASSRLIGG